MTDITKFSEQELRAELNRRKIEEERIELERREKQNLLAQKLFENIDVINLFASEHQTRYCSDTNFYTSGNPFDIRCMRCACLRFKESPHSFEGVTLRFSIDL